MFNLGTIARAAVTSVLLVTGTVAGAASVSDYEAKTGAIEYTGTGAATVFGMNLAFNGTGTPPAPTVGSDTLSLTAVDLSNPSAGGSLLLNRTVAVPPPLPPLLIQIFQSSILHDVQSSAGSIDMLYETAFPAAGVGGFSGFVLVTLGNGSFTSTFIDDVIASPFTLPMSFAATSYSVVEAVSATPIPLPASSLLLVAGVGGLMAMRRRKRA